MTRPEETPIDPLDTLHYSDNDSDTYCFIDLDSQWAIYTGDPRMDGINCPRCLSEMADDKVGVARQVAKLERAGF